MDQLTFTKMQEHMIEECVDLFINTFTKAPWYDEYESREQVVNFFHNHMSGDRFVGYVVMSEGKIVALSAGTKKPWIKGFEYYIDEFCVSHELQGKGIGSWFLTMIENDISNQGMNAIILLTEKAYPSQSFYEKNGFQVIKDLLVLAK